MEVSSDDIIPFDSPACRDTARVGGKNASLGQLFFHLCREGVAVPGGFATSTNVYRAFLEHNDLSVLIDETMAALAARDLNLREAGRRVREAFLKAEWPAAARREILKGYAALAGAEGPASVAVRSSATAEDLPEASFAGQQDTYLNVRGDQAVLDACRRCYASLFTDRAISYRLAHGFDHLALALSIGVQRMVRSDLGCAGVMFTLDTESGFDKVVTVTGAWGLGENVVQGAVDPDEFIVFKPLLDTPGLTPIIDRRLGGKEKKMIYGQGEQPTQNVDTTPQERRAWVLDDADVLKLARWACRIEAHYGCPMDMEWARDGATGELYIVQARPETVQRNRDSGRLQSYRLKAPGDVLLAGLAVGQAVVTGKVCVIHEAREIERFEDGCVLVTGTTDPDWVPIMKRAAAIVTDHGGRTSHAAIVSRELGLPAILGAEKATAVLRDGQEVTVSCAEGDEGHVYAGKVDYTVEEIDLSAIPRTRTRIMLNLANPATAFQWWRLPAEGIGLVRMEFVVNNHVRVHPMALLRFDTLPEGPDKTRIAELTQDFADKAGYFVERLALGLARFAALYHPHPAIIRMSDFKTNEYAHLLGGEGFEPREENPMLGFRGASRYYSPRYREAFALECRAIRRIREEMGLRNAVVMIPFCRTLDEARQVLAVMAENGLVRGENGLEVYVMCEVPSNVVLARRFAELFDGFSIGSNDLTQLTLGVDRDSGELAPLFSERDEAVTWMIRTAIEGAHAGGAKIGLCGQAPSDHPDFAAFLVECGIDSISVIPDSFVAVKKHVAEAESKKGDGETKF